MTSFPPGHKKLAVICILKNGNRLLLLKRNKAPHQGLFTPVGGKLEPFESPIEAAHREVWEETGLKIEKFRYGGIITETSPVKYNWVCWVYVADIEDCPPPECNEGTLEWIEADLISEVNIPETNHYIYRYVFDQKPFAFQAVYDEKINLVELIEENENLCLVENKKEADRS